MAGDRGAVTFTAYPAPAKLNLFLQVVGQRADGYHELQTVFCILDWGDTVHLQTTDDGAIQRADDGVDGVAENADLMIRAARLLQGVTGTHHGARIRIDKRIPMGGGMGGGSSDAATVLVGLNQLWDTQLNLTQLAQLGAQLGADVPVFVQGVHAWAEGVGERLTPIDLPPRWYLCAMPDVRTDTGQLFGDPLLTRDANPVKISDFLEGQIQVNAFEAVLRRRETAVDQLFALLHERVAGTPRLTGTGSAVFVEYSDRDSAQAALQALPKGLNAWIAAAATLSPLHRSVAEHANHH